MSAIQSSTTMVSSPYATMTATSKSAKPDLATKPNATGTPTATAAAVSVVGASPAAGESATVTFSEKALGALNDAGQFIGDAALAAAKDGADAAGEGVLDVGHAAVAVYDAVKNGVAGTVHGAEDLAGAGWGLGKDGVDGVLDLAGDGLDAAKAGVSTAGHVVAGVWHG